MRFKINCLVIYISFNDLSDREAREYLHCMQMEIELQRDFLVNVTLQMSDGFGVQTFVCLIYQKQCAVWLFVFDF